jgi:NADH dehydrogenase
VQRAFERDEAWGKVFEIGGPDVMTMDDVIRTMCEVMGKRRAILPIPAALAKLATAPLILLPKPPMTPLGIDFAVQDGVVDSSDTEEVLDVHPVTLREGLSRYLRSER